MRTFPRWRRALAVLVPLLALPRAGAAQPAQGEAHAADPRSAARSLANEAANAFARRDYASAHELCGRAYALVPAPTIALLDARSLVQMRRYVDANRAYDRVLAVEMGAEAPEPFKRAVHDATLERAALVPRIPRLKVLPPAGRPAGSVSVRLDERSLAQGDLGAWIVADPGHHRVRVELDEKTVLDQSVTLADGDARVLFVETPSGPGDTLRGWGYVGLGAGAAGVAVGVIAGTTAMNAHEDAEQNCPDDTCVAGSRGADALERFRTYRAISTVGYVAGAAALTFGAVAVFWPRSETRLSIAAGITGFKVQGEL